MSENVNLYVMDESIDSEKSTVNYIDVGIHENIKLTEIRFDISKNDNQFISFTFENENGNQLVHTEYEPRLNDNSEDARKQYDKKRLNQMKRIKHIATKIVSENEFKFTATDFKDFCTKTLAILTPDKYEDKLFRIKATYSWNNYVTLPNYTPFIEDMALVPKEKSRLSILSLDKITKDRPDVETPQYISSDPFATTEDSDIPTSDTDEKDDLPF